MRDKSRETWSRQNQGSVGSEVVVLANLQVLSSVSTLEAYTATLFLRSRALYMRILSTPNCCTTSGGGGTRSVVRLRVRERVREKRRRDRKREERRERERGREREREREKESAKEKKRKGGSGQHLNNYNVLLQQTQADTCNDRV